MSREETIIQLKQFFQIRELVCDHIFAKWGEASWQFIPTFALENLLILRRDIIQKPMICNNDSQHQRGVRCNMCKLVKGKTSVYMSAHILGIAWDFTVVETSAEEARRKIILNADKFTHPCRLEADVNWLHIDFLNQYGIKEKVHLFKA